MCLVSLAKIKTFHICLLILWFHSSSSLRLKSAKSSMHLRGHKASRRNHANDNSDNSQASRRSTYRINMPIKVAKLLLPQITNKNQETIIRIYPDRSAETQNQTGRNYMLSLSYKKLNDDGVPSKDFCQRGGCCCCPGMNVDPMSICRPGCPVCPTPCVCCCCSSPPPPPPPPPPKKPPPAPCPMVCLPCCPCVKPCPCRPCIPRPILRPCHPPCRIPAPPITGPMGPCITAPPVMGPCHPPCLPKLPPIRPQPQRQPFSPVTLNAAPPILANGAIIVDHPLKGPPIFIDQCRDAIAECKDYAKRGMCNHPSPFHTIQQIRKICPFSCGICNDYDENAALLRRNTRVHSKFHVAPAMRAKLNTALEQIIRNEALEGHSTVEPQEDKPAVKEEQTGEKKSHDTISIQTKSHDSQMPLEAQEEDLSGSGGSGEILSEIT